jgi:uncharacterized protein (DUF302 family)
MAIVRARKRFGMRRALGCGYEEALARVPEALREEGFGVLTEIDVRETLKKKLGTEFRPYKILGACNPPLAHRALQAELEVGLMLPCNVIVYEGDDGRAVVAAIDPLQTVAAQAGPELRGVAREVRERLERALDRLAAAAAPGGGPNDVGRQPSFLT